MHMKQYGARYTIAVSPERYAISPDRSACLFFGCVHLIVLRLAHQHRTPTAEKLFLDDSSHLLPCPGLSFLVFCFLFYTLGRWMCLDGKVPTDGKVATSASPLKMAT